MSQLETGKRIAERRKEKGYTQKQLADLVHVTDKAVSKWERGDSYPETALLVPLAAALDATVDELLGAAAPRTETASGARSGKKHPGLFAGNWTALMAAAIWALAAVPLCVAGWLAGGWWGALPLALCLPPWLASLALVTVCRTLPGLERRVCVAALAVSGCLLAIGLLGPRLVLAALMPAYCIAMTETLMLLMGARLRKKPQPVSHKWLWASAALLCAVPGSVLVGVGLGALRYGGWQRGASWYVLRMELWWPWLWASLAAGAAVWLALRTARETKARLPLLLPALLPLLQCWCLSASARRMTLCLQLTLAAAAALPGLAWAAGASRQKEDLQNSTNVV